MMDTRCARYSADPCRSLFSPPASTRTAFAASGVKLCFSALSIADARNTDGAAPVTATRTSPFAAFDTNTPTSAKRDAGFGNFA
jgi:hypothetical protein